MTRYLKDIRLVPVVLLATICLFALKVFGLVFEGGYTLTVSRSGVADERPVPLAAARPLGVPAANEGAKAPPARQSWAQEMFNFPDVTGSVGERKPEAGAVKGAVRTAEAAPAAAPAAATGAAPAAKDKPGAPKSAEPKPADPKATDPKPGPAGIVINQGEAPTSPAERAILERLQQRRQELDARARELDIRDSLLRATEKRLDARVTELKDLEARVTAATQKKDEADVARFKGIVTMYENMKPKDAAKIFDRLEMRILVEVATQMNPRRMSDIMAQMQPDAAQQLTVELANRAAPEDKAATTNELPKIEGHPNGT